MKTLVVLAVLPLVLLGGRSFATPADGNRSCGDFIWESCEYCGQDCCQQTGGQTDMTHDCRVNVTDFGLFARAYFLWGSFGTLDPTGDFNSNGMVMWNDFAIFAASYYSNTAVTPCTYCPDTQDGCTGTARVSFSLNPAVDLDRIDLEPGEVVTAWVYVEGCDGLAAEIGCLTASSNVILGSESSPSGGLTMSGGGTGFYPSLDGSAHNVLGVSVEVIDTEPAWIRITPCTGHPTGYQLCWSRTNPPQAMFFESLRHGGINGDPPPDGIGCAWSSVDPLAGGEGPAFRIHCEPNPNNGKARIRIDVPSDLSGQVLVFDSAGRAVRHLMDGPVGPATMLEWNGRDDGGRELPSGVYFVRLGSNAGSAESPLIVLR